MIVDCGWPVFRCRVVVLVILAVSVSAFGVAECFDKPVDLSFVADCDGATQKYIVMLPGRFDADQPHSLGAYPENIQPSCIAYSPTGGRA